MNTSMPDTSQATSPARGVSYLFMAAAFVVVVAGMRAAEAILNPLLLAIFLSIISAPAYLKLLKRGVSNWLSLLTVVGVLSAIVILLVFIVMGSIQGFMENADHYEQRLREEQRRAELTVERWLPETWLLRKNSPEKISQKPLTVVKEEDTSDLSNEGQTLESVSTQPSPEQRPIDTDTPVTSTELDGAESPDDDANKPTITESAAGLVVESVTTLAAPGRPTQIPIGMGSSLGFPTPNTTLQDSDRNYEDYIKEQFSFSTAISLARGVVFSIGQLLSNAFLILLIVIFILLEVGTFGRKLKDAMERTEETQDRANQIINSVQHYIAIKTWVSLATGLLITLWLWFWGVSHSPLWGLLAFLFNYIPNVGSIIAAVPAVLVAWLDVGALPAAMTSVGYIVVNGAIGNFLEPRLMGKSLGLSPLVIFFSMLFWGWVLGPVGMLLSVPLTMAARIALDGFDDTRWLATLMGNVE